MALKKTSAKVVYQSQSLKFFVPCDKLKLTRSFDHVTSIISAQGFGKLRSESVFIETRQLQPN